ncbi:hypothetical protein F511_07369 [Dorcoceras hygrometricum]|uniref:Uncharacterized protein n=1 Tax=Dorcoceras hygrometricum TaxID=472368 RepID=A0A2Z7BHB0_9LAMI|nr:hypothetical protein F511_07369 [Dorcoceras hygrometricum]
MSYISHSSTSEGSTRRFDLTTSCTDPIPQPAALATGLVSTLRLLLLFLRLGIKSTGNAIALKLETGYIATADSKKLSTGCCCCLRLVVQLADVITADSISCASADISSSADHCSFLLNDDVTSDVIYT